MCAAGHICDARPRVRHGGWNLAEVANCSATRLAAEVRGSDGAVDAWRRWAASETDAGVRRAGGEMWAVVRALRDDADDDST